MLRSTRRTRRLLAGAGLLGVGALLAAFAHRSAAGPRYLALGDSLAASSQAHGSRDRGYAEEVWRHEARRIPGLVLVKLGRGGETAARIIRSPRSGPSQLAAAEAQLRRHRTALVTIDIGANEVERCQHGFGFDGRCVAAGLASLRRNLSQILGGLRAAAPASTPIVGINYYNSFLGYWVRGRGGRLLARRSMPVERAINATLAAVYRRFGVPVADVEHAFASHELHRYVRVLPYGRLPLAVARVCRWTWSCADDGDDHANTTGYAVIARAVERVLSSLGLGRRT
jgi:lysophospholipase L1-like esterase